MGFQFTLQDIDVFSGRFWASVGTARLFAVHGAMGAGKTTVIEALCKAKGVQEPMGSPTLSIINEYTYTEHGTEKIIYHIDLYRLEDEAEIMRTGVEECIYSPHLCFVEWPERALGLFDSSAAHLYLDIISEQERRVKITLPSLSMEEQS